MAPTLLTVGHGRLDRAGLGQLLTDAGVQQLVDVRRFPGSRNNPDSRREALQEWLPATGITYRWEVGLGGRRRLAPEEEAEGLDRWWQVVQFRAYAAHTGASSSPGRWRPCWSRRAGDGPPGLWDGA